MNSLLKRQLKKHFGSEADLPPAVASFAAAVSESYHSYEGDAQILHRAMELSSQELNDANLEVRAVIQAIPDVILRIDRDGKVMPLKAPAEGTEAHSQRFAKLRIGSSLAAIENGELRAAFQNALSDLLRDGQQKTFTYSVPDVDGASFFEVRLVALQKDAIAIIQDITKRKQAETEHERLNQELIRASRQAGKAEVATSVLHNVGNVLNSVNLSVSLLVEHTRKSKIATLQRTVRLIEEHRSDLGAYLTSDAKGKLLPAFLSALAGELVQEQARLIADAEGLQRNIEHIKEIVAMQQSFARVSGVTESLSVPELVDEAIRIASLDLGGHSIELVRNFGTVPAVSADRHIVLQILVNLITNAQQALDHRSDGRQIRIDVGPGERGSVRVEVADNGVGIPRENLIRIFSHGFTTKKSGHGFGLHSSANAAKEMGGRLYCHSAGAGAGATFVLEIPRATTAPVASTSDDFAALAASML